MSLLVPRNGPIATGGSDNVVRLWDRETGQQVAQLSGHTGTIAALAFDGTRLYSGGFDTTVRIWQFESGAENPTRTVDATDNTTSPAQR